MFKKIIAVTVMLSAMGAQAAQPTEAQLKFTAEPLAVCGLIVEKDSGGIRFSGEVEPTDKAIVKVLANKENPTITATVTGTNLETDGKTITIQGIDKPQHDVAMEIFAEYSGTAYDVINHGDIFVDAVIELQCQ